MTSADIRRKMQHSTMANHKIVLLETIADEAQKLLEAAEDVEITHPGEEFDASKTTAIITRGKGQVNEELITSMPELKAIARCGVGLDNVNVQYATNHNIQVLNTPGINSATIAEHTLGLMLMLQRKLYISAKEVKEGNWAYRKVYDGDEVRGKTLGILGFGNIGQRVAALADCFGMEVVYSNEGAVDSKHSFVDLNELLTRSDIITIHLPLTPGTKGLLAENQFPLMKSGALIINTARGAVVDEKALIDALQKGKLGGYAADVLTEEPPEADHPLLGFDNVLLTPHAGSLTKKTYDDICVTSIVNTLAYLRGEKVDDRYLVNNLS